MATDRALHVLCALIAAALAGCALAPPDAESELRLAIGAAQRVSIGGPADIPLADRTVLELDAGFSYIPAAEGGRLLRALGGRTRPNLLGVVVAGPLEAAEVASLYAREADPALPVVAVDGWKNAPALAGFRRKK